MNEVKAAEIQVHWVSTSGTTWRGLCGGRHVMVAFVTTVCGLPKSKTTPNDHYHPASSSSASSWRFMGTYNSNNKCTYNLLRGLRGLMTTCTLGVISTLNLQVLLQLSVLLRPRHVQP